MRADLRAAAVYATDCSREIAQWAHLLAGTTAIREGSRLERAFRDLYTGTQHAFISERVAIEAAQVWLGLARGPPRPLRYRPRSFDSLVVRFGWRRGGHPQQWASASGTLAQQSGSSAAVVGMERRLAEVSLSSSTA